MTPKKLFVLDTSALLALRRNEAGAAEVESILRQAARSTVTVLVSFMSRMELLYLIWRAEDEPAARQALRLVDSFPIEWVSCEAEILEAASALKRQGGLSVAGSWIAATAQFHGATLIHKDPEFRILTQIQQRYLNEA